ncbi:MAG: Polysaccharide biosynthesis protein [Parcubacteria group bacterium GW2011_GWA2_38_13]|nr:MAG: Polysaccharide biosynthesis protein [Parcubacteria group bacterium GW2011_GWA2_38_13]
MSLTRTIAHNTIIQIIGKGTGLIFSVFTLGIITRYLGPTQFGYYTTAFAFLQIFGILIDFGLQMITTQLISDPNEDESIMLSNIFTLRLLSALIFFIAPVIAIFFPYPNAVKIGIGITSLTYLFTVLSTILVGLFQKHLLMGKVALADFLSKFIFFLLALCAMYFNWGIIGIFIVSAFGSAVYFAIVYFYGRKITKITFAVNFDKWKIIFSRSWPIALSIALNLIYFKADTIILSLNKSQHDVGLYGAPYKILETLIGLSYLFLGLLLPLLTNSYAQKKYEHFRAIIQQGFDVMVIVSVPIIFGTYIQGNKIMALVAGKDYIVSGDILKILVIASGAIFVSAVFGYAIVAMNKQKLMIKFYLINAVISLIAYFIFIPTYSYWAAAWITVCSELFIMCFAFFILYKNTNFFPRLKVFFAVLGSSVIMAMALYIIKDMNIIISLGLGTMVYGISLYTFGGISRKTIIEITKIK